MTYSAAGLIAMGTGGAVGSAPGNRKTIYHYATNDTVAQASASGYFNTEYQKLNVGDVIILSADIDGTPDAEVLMVATNSGGVVTTTAVSLSVVAGAAVTSLTDSTGGSANDTLTALGGLTTLTDSTGLSGTHDDTLAATTVPSDITGGESPTEAEHNAALAVMRVMAQNQSDVAQKMIEVVADMEDCRNNFADLAAKVNTILTRLRTAGVIAT